MLRLQLMRHGKSDWEAAFPSDHERPLARRGEEAARAMGTFLRRAGELPDLVISSTAVRARTTAELARIAGGWPCPLELESQLYGASPREVLVVAGRHADQQKRLLLTGHEPAWSQLVGRLTGARARMRTATVAAIDLDITDWSEADGARGTLAYLVHPKMVAAEEPR